MQVSSFHGAHRVAFVASRQDPVSARLVEALMGNLEVSHECVVFEEGKTLEPLSMFPTETSVGFTTVIVQLVDRRRSTARHPFRFESASPIRVGEGWGTLCVLGIQAWHNSSYLLKALRHCFGSLEERRAIRHGRKRSTPYWRSHYRVSLSRVYP